MHFAQSLSTAKPLFFGRAQRVRRMAKEIGDIMQLTNTWRLDVAAAFFSTCLHIDS